MLSLAICTLYVPRMMIARSIKEHFLYILQHFFSVYFSAQTGGDKGQGVMSLDPDRVSCYALEKLLEFIYTGEMSSLVR